MKDLIERLKKAVGPDRVIDGLIFKAVEEKPGDVWTQDIGSEEIWYRQDPDDTVAYDIPPFFTASIDAALTLVPYQREWHIGSVTLLGEFWAEIVTPTERHIAKGAKTPAIALCIAALRARAALTGETR